MRAVERRSRRIQAEYKAGARKGDEQAGAVAGQNWTLSTRHNIK